MSNSKQLTQLASELGTALKAQSCMLILAESCTGGMIAEAITRVAGSSAWFDRGFITYSNQSKIDLLNVKAHTLENHGAVSEPIAKEMALGCLSQTTNMTSRNIIVASVTGIAGPDGGTALKPVGTVCFGWAGANLSATAQTQLFIGNRQQIRQQATIYLLQTLINQLNTHSS